MDALSKLRVPQSELKECQSIAALSRNSAASEAHRRKAAMLTVKQPSRHERGFAIRSASYQPDPIELLSEFARRASRALIART
ncbi:hypothetical protein [Bradyrhizobium sp. USDA 3315]